MGEAAEKEKVKPVGQEFKSLELEIAKNDDFTQLLKVDLIRDEILKYLDGSALINFSDVNRTIRQLVTSSKEYKNCVNLRVNTKTLDLFTNEEPLPGWTAHLTNLTLICNSEFVFVSQEKIMSLSKTFLNLSTLEIINESETYAYATKFVNKILGLSSNLKSLSLPYDLLLNPIDFDQFQWCQQLEELKFTTTGTDGCDYDFKSDKFVQNLKYFSSKCIKLKSFTFQEVGKCEGRYINTEDEYNLDDFDGILQIIENNSESLEKLEFGISQLLTTLKLSLKFAKISFPKLKIFDLRILRTDDLDDENEEPIIPTVIEILNNLPQPGQLTTLKLTLTIFPLELFDLIPQKFPQLKSLSLKASRNGVNSGNNYKLNEDFRWSFLQLLTELEELEIIRFKTYEIGENKSEFGFEISEKFPIFQNNNLRKLAIKGIKCLPGTTEVINGIENMTNLRDLTLTAISLNIDDFMMICTSLKLLEKLEISCFDPRVDLEERHLESCDFLAVFTSLKYLKEMSIELEAGDFSEVLGSISFPYLSSLTLGNANLEKEKLVNIIDLNPMLKELSIVRLTERDDDNPDKKDQEEIFEIDSERKNLKIENLLKQVKTIGNEKVRDDSDPDSIPLDEWDSQDGDSDTDISENSDSYGDDNDSDDNDSDDDDDDSDDSDRVPSLINLY